MTKPALSGTTRKATTWCGPYAMATVCGMDYDTVYKKMLRAYNKRTPYKRKYISGVTNTLMQIVSKTVKHEIEFKRAERVTSVSQYLNYLYPNRVYILQITGHYIVVDTSDWTVCDNQSQEWVPLKGSKHIRCKVRNVAEVKKVTLPH